MTIYALANGSQPRQVGTSFNSGPFGGPHVAEVFVDSLQGGLFCEFSIAWKMFARSRYIHGASAGGRRFRRFLARDLGAAPRRRRGRGRGGLGPARGRGWRWNTGRETKAPLRVAPCSLSRRVPPPMLLCFLFCFCLFLFFTLLCFFFLSVFVV